MKYLFFVASNVTRECLLLLLYTCVALCTPFPPYAPYEWKFMFVCCCFFAVVLYKTTNGDKRSLDVKKRKEWEKKIEKRCHSSWHGMVDSYKQYLVTIKKQLERHQRWDIIA